MYWCQFFYDCIDIKFKNKLVTHVCARELGGTEKRACVCVLCTVSSDSIVVVML